MSRHHPILNILLSKKKNLTFFDRIILLAAIAYPLSTIPQILTVYSGRTDGISIVSWLGYSGFALLFLIYGLHHKIPPMIVGNFLWLSVDTAVVIGVLAQRI
jgi:hypothetical protein